MKKWYLIAYDVREAKRLRKVHYFLRKQALALQKSVFLVEADGTSLEELLRGVRMRADHRVDDIRLYPVAHPDAIWAAGKKAATMSGLYAAAPIKQEQSRVKAFIKTLLGKE